MIVITTIAESHHCDFSLIVSLSYVGISSILQLVTYTSIIIQVKITK